MTAKNLVKTALFASLILLATSFIKVPIGLGYIHLGDAFIFVACYFLKPKYAAVAAGIGSMLADLIAGYVIYMPVTLVLKAAMALVSGLIMYKHSTLWREIVGFLISGIIMLGGYFMFEWIYYGLSPAVANLPLSAVQPAVALVCAVLVIEGCKRFNKHRYER